MALSSPLYSSLVLSGLGSNYVPFSIRSVGAEVGKEPPSSTRFLSGQIFGVLRRTRRSFPSKGASIYMTSTGLRDFLTPSPYLCPQNWCIFLPSPFCADVIYGSAPSPQVRNSTPPPSSRLNAIVRTTDGALLSFASFNAACAHFNGSSGGPNSFDTASL